MTPTALILITISTLAHAFWNYLSQKSKPAAGFFELALLGAVVFFLPLLAFYAHALPAIPLSVWGWLLFTGLLQAIYFIGLAGAYRHGQLSIIYPLVRALPVLGITIISLCLGIGARLTPIGGLGIALVVLGCLFTPLPSFHSLNPRHYFNLACALALLAASGTIGYTLVDNEALSILRTTPGLSLTPIEVAFFYLELEMIFTALALGLYILFKPSERAVFGGQFRKRLRTAVSTGIIINTAYGLVLAAMAYVTNISYLSAFRQFSIPIGACLGIWLQKEPAGAPKISGITSILAGLVLITLA